MKHTNIQLNHHIFFIQLLDFTNIIFIFISIIIHTNSLENPIKNKTLKNEIQNKKLKFNSQLHHYSYKILYTNQ
jgi:hypothetical protein